MKVKQGFLERLTNYLNTDKEIYVACGGEKFAGRLVELYDADDRSFIVLHSISQTKTEPQSLWHVDVLSIDAWGVVFDDN